MQVKAHRLWAREVVTQPATCVSPDTPLAEAVRIMEQKRIKRLPVIAGIERAGLVASAASAARPAPVVAQQQEVDPRKFLWADAGICC